MNEMSNILKSFVYKTIQMLVDNPDDVMVDISTSTKNVIVQIKVNDSDCGKVIGKKGKTIESLKTITLAIKNTNYSDDKRKVSLELLEDETRNFNQ